MANYSRHLLDPIANKFTYPVNFLQALEEIRKNSFFEFTPELLAKLIDSLSTNWHVELGFDLHKSGLLSSVDREVWLSHPVGAYWLARWVDGGARPDTRAAAMKDYKVAYKYALEFEKVPRRDLMDAISTNDRGRSYDMDYRKQAANRVFTIHDIVDAICNDQNLLAQLNEAIDRSSLSMFEEEQKRALELLHKLNSLAEWCSDDLIVRGEDEKGIFFTGLTQLFLSGFRNLAVDAAEIFGFNYENGGKTFRIETKLTKV